MADETTNTTQPTTAPDPTPAPLTKAPKPTPAPKAKAPRVVTIKKFVPAGAEDKGETIDHQLNDTVEVFRDVLDPKIGKFRPKKVKVPVTFARDFGSTNADGSPAIAEFDDSWTEDKCTQVLRAGQEDEHVCGHDLAQKVNLIAGNTYEMAGGELGDDGIYVTKWNGDKVRCSSCHAIFTSAAAPAK